MCRKDQSLFSDHVATIMTVAEESLEFPVDELRNSIEHFVTFLMSKGYVGTTLNQASHSGRPYTCSLTYIHWDFILYSCGHGLRRYAKIWDTHVSIGDRITNLPEVKQIILISIIEGYIVFLPRLHITCSATVKSQIVSFYCILTFFQ